MLVIASMPAAKKYLAHTACDHLYAFSVLVHWLGDRKGIWHVKNAATKVTGSP